MRHHAVALTAALLLLTAGAAAGFEITPDDAVALVDGRTRTTIKTAFDSFVPRTILKDNGQRPDQATPYADTVLVLPRTHGDDDRGVIYYVSLSGGRKGADVARIEILARTAGGGTRVLDVAPIGRDGARIPVFANGSGSFVCDVTRRGRTESWSCEGEYPSRRGRILRRLIFVSSDDAQAEIPAACKEMPGETLITALSAGRKTLACGYVSLRPYP